VERYAPRASKTDRDDHSTITSREEVSTL
jgi:hypothetical protein